MKVFVYGTLLKGMERFVSLDGCRFIGNGFIQGSLYDLGPYPALAVGDTRVYGELYEVDDEKLKKLDSIEGYFSEDRDNSLYVREEVDVELFRDGSPAKAYTYFYNKALCDAVLIECGDYRRYISEKQSDMQWYIAYGSNMSSERLKARVEEIHGVKTGYLDGYKLRFNKIADRGGVFANIEYTGDSGHRCPFVAYLMRNEKLHELDRYEGEPRHYVRIGIAFSAMEENACQIGHIYIANTEKLTLEGTPGKEYLKYIHDGYEEHGFDTTELPVL